MRPVLICLVTLLASSPISLRAFEKVYWADSWDQTIRRANLDGSDVELLVTTDGDGGPTDIAMDLTAGVMYWRTTNASVINHHVIQRANFDGTDVESLPIDIQGGSSFALDASAGMIYFGESFRDAPGDFQSTTYGISRVKLDGTGAEELASNVGHSRGLALDTVNDKLYWPSSWNAAPLIWHTSLDGTDEEILIPSNKLSDPYAIAIDTQEGKLYWTDRNPGRIRRADTDGSDIETIVPGIGKPNKIALDLEKGKVYWTDTMQGPTAHANLIQRANLDGSEVEIVVSGLTMPFGLAIVRTPSVFGAQVLACVSSR